jgi:hypothetical protein
MTDEKPSYYQLNKERMIANSKKYQKEHRDKVKEYQKEYFQKNKDELSKRHRVYREKHYVPKPRVKKIKPQKNELPLYQLFVPEPEPEPEPTIIYTNQPIIVTFD